MRGRGREAAGVRGVGRARRRHPGLVRPGVGRPVPVPVPVRAAVLSGGSVRGRGSRRAPAAEGEVGGAGLVTGGRTAVQKLMFIVLLEVKLLAKL